MTDMKHTPGPWVVDECNLIFAGMSEIADVYGSNDALCAEGFEAECDANARLISAAPDLLEGNREGLALLGDITRFLSDLDCKHQDADPVVRAVFDAIHVFMGDGIPAMTRNLMNAAVAKATGEDAP